MSKKGGSAFAEDDSEELELDPKTKGAIEQLARNVATYGIDYENQTKRNNKSNPVYWFLYDVESAAYKYYVDLVKNAGKKDANFAACASPSVNAAMVHKELELDPKTKGAIEQLARNVATYGIDYENQTKRNNKSNPVYWFLYDVESAAYKYYVDLVKNAGKKDANFAACASPVNAAMVHKADIDQKSANDVTSVERLSRKRKSRWGEKVCAEETCAQPVVVAAPLAYSVSTPSLELAGSPALVMNPNRQPSACASNSNANDEGVFDEEAFKRQILASQLAAKALAKATKKEPPCEYDSDEDTEGGTFEHKRRMAEMQKTYAQAKELTEKSKGKHHLVDFLPLEEQEKFWAALTKFRKSDGTDQSLASTSNEDYLENKLQEDNLGFKLLQKMGWSTGKGLGAKEQGITAPVNKGRAPSDTQGLGAEKSEDDKDIFDVYRKRMMLAYKFRPNPLNNPRRPYY